MKNNYKKGGAIKCSKGGAMPCNCLACGGAIKKADGGEIGSIMQAAAPLATLIPGAGPFIAPALGLAGGLLQKNQAKKDALAAQAAMYPAYADGGPVDPLAQSLQNIDKSIQNKDYKEVLKLAATREWNGSNFTVPERAYNPEFSFISQDAQRFATKQKDNLYDERISSKAKKDAQLNQVGKNMYGPEFGYAEGGQINSISSGMDTVDANNPNDQDSVSTSYKNQDIAVDHKEVIDNDKGFVFSEKLKDPSTGKSFASEATKYGKAIGKAEKVLQRNPSDLYAKNAITALKANASNVAMKQELFKQQTEKPMKQTKKFADGGPIDPKTGKPIINYNPNSPLSFNGYYGDFTPTSNTTTSNWKSIGNDLVVTPQNDTLYRDPNSGYYYNASTTPETSITPRASIPGINAPLFGTTSNSNSIFNAPTPQTVPVTKVTQGSMVQVPGTNKYRTASGNRPTNPTGNALVNQFQTLYNKHYPDTQLRVDGIMGPKTKAALGNTDPNLLDQNNLQFNNGTLMGKVPGNTNVSTSPRDFRPAFMKPGYTETAPALGTVVPDNKVTPGSTTVPGTDNLSYNPPSTGKSSFTTGDYLQMGAAVGSLIPLLSGPEKQRAYLDKSKISKEFYDPRAQLAQSNRQFNISNNSIQSNIGNPALATAAMSNLYGTKMGNDTDLLSKYDMMNKQANQQYEQRLQGQNQYNNQAMMQTDTINAQNRGAYNNSVQAGLGTVSNFGQALNQKKQYQSWEELQKLIYQDAITKKVFGQ